MDDIVGYPYEFSLTDEVAGVLGEDDVPAVVAVVQGLEDEFRVVGYEVIVAFHVADLAPGGRVVS